jgi:hypothetical protein
MEPLEQLAAFGQSLIKESLKRMDAAAARGDAECALQWGSVSAWVNANGGTFGDLSSVELEQRLIAAAGKISPVEWRHGPAGKRRVLHVMSLAYRIFGHTKFCRKWIELDAAHSRHNVVLTAQELEVPENVRQIVEGQGGFLRCLDLRRPLLERAAHLRQLACEHADLVVLHIHPDDVVPFLAFGVPGGPPVVYVNHADHLPWTGGMIADRVLDIRDSGHVWTKVHRGVPRAKILPIPLEGEVDFSRYDEIRAATRARLGIPVDAQMFLTVGNARKYVPMPGLSFLAAVSGILEACPQGRVVAVGPSLSGEWAEVAKKFNGRLLALGNQDDLAQFHCAADVYLEGIPGGSLTALLEAGLAGLPFVRTPAQALPPFVSDDVALDDPQPASTVAYVQEAVTLAGDRVRSKQRGDRQRRRILETLCEGGWLAALGLALADLPEAHRIHDDLKPVPVPVADRDFWLRYLYSQNMAGAATRMVGTAVQVAIGRCTDVRRELEELLLGKAKASADEAELKRKIVALVFPNAVASAAGLGLAPEKISLNLARVREILLHHAAREGRWGAARRMAVRACCRQPGLLRERSFATCVLKALAGPVLGGVLRKMKRS